MTPSRLQISAGRLRQVRLAVYVLILLLLLYGVQGLWRLRPDIGQPFAGAPVSWDRVTGFYVAGEVPWNWPGPQNGLKGLDKIVSVDGKDPYSFFKEEFRDKDLGELARFEIERSAERRIVSVPTSSFTIERLFEQYGFWFFAGISCAAASLLFIRTAQDEARIVLSLIFTTIAAALFSHGYAGSIHRFFFPFDPPTMIIWAGAFPLIGALLIHFAVVYPYPLRWFERRPYLRLVPFTWVLIVTTLLFVGRHWLFDKQLDSTMTNLSLATAGIGGIAVTVRPFWAFLQGKPGERKGALYLGSAWAVGAVLLIGVGIFPYIAHGATMIVTEILLPLCTIYPLMLVYAVRNTDFMEQLRQEIAEKDQFADEVSELRGIRERTLHEVADQLHDTVVADARGLQLWAGAMRKRLHSYLDPEEAEELEFLERTLHKVYADGRRIMEGAKPVDFAAEGLIQPLRRLVTQANAAGWWEAKVQCELSFDDRAVDPATAEDIYWIVSTALNNCRDHAGAQSIAIRVDRVDSALHVSVGDDGCGFSPLEATVTATGPGRRHLGLRNMHMRARRLNANLEIDSDSEGTSVRLMVPLGGER